MLASWYSAWRQRAQQLRPLTQAISWSLAPSIRPSQLVVDKHRHANQPLVLVFRRPQVSLRQGQIAASLGPATALGGAWLHARRIQSLYDGSLLSMRVDGQRGRNQTPSIGVRQGCPLSATLFGIFIDGLQHHLQTTTPAAGVQIRHSKLTDCKLSLMLW